jgi:hypothetical protein
MQRVLVVISDVSGQPIGSIYMGYQFLDGLTVEDGADILFPDSKRNCRSKLWKNSKRAQISFLQPRNPEIAQFLWYLWRTKRKCCRCLSRYCFGLPFPIIIPIKLYRLFVYPSSDSWTVSSSIRVALVLRPTCFTPF